MQKSIEKISPETLDLLKQYSCPGNIRELENAIERAVVLATGSELTPDLLPLLIKKTKPDEIGVGIPLEDALSKFKKSFITSTLSFTKNNQTKAAELLKIQRTYLNRLIKELNIKE